MEELEKALGKLPTDALHYQIRYDTVRMLPIAHFPFTVHYRADEGKMTVFVEALIHTSRSPERWKNR